MEYKGASEIRRNLVCRISQNFFSNVSEEAISASDWQILDFSSVFFVETLQQDSKYGVFVKIPKDEILYQGVISKSTASMEMARNEFESLSYLKKYWLHNNVSFIEPLMFYEDCWAIVTRRAYGDDFFLPFRSVDLKERVKKAPEGKEWVRRIGMIGSALKKYHQNSHEAEGSREVIFRAVKLIGKIKNTCDYLKGYVSNNKFLDKVENDLACWGGFDVSLPLVKTLKGLDIRNVIYGEDDRIYLLDPGKLKSDTAMADLARYLVTCEIIYWGSLWFFLKLRPKRIYITETLRQYGKITKDEESVLNLLILKEYMKHWKAAYVALSLKNWPGLLKKILMKIYIDRFYMSVVSKQMEILSSLGK